jgi:hypothetical protein
MISCGMKRILLRGGSAGFLDFQLGRQRVLIAIMGSSTQIRKKAVGLLKLS